MTTSSVDLTDKLVFVLSAVMAIAIFVTIRIAFPDYFKFAWNPYAILSILQITILSGVLIALFMKKAYLQARIWFSITLVGAIAVGLGELLMRLSIEDNQALFWSSISVAGLSVIPLGFYMFTHFFIGRDNKKGVTIAPIVITVTGGALLVITLASQTVGLMDKTALPWGYVIPATASYLVMTFWLGLVVLVCAAKFIGHFMSSISKVHRQQSRIIFSGALASVAGGLLLGVLPRFLGFDVVPVGVLLQIVLPLTVIYAMYHYESFEIDFAATATAILDTLNEGVIVTDRALKIHMVNRYGLELIQYGSADVVGRPVSNLFESAAFDTITNKIKHAPVVKQENYMIEGEIITKTGSKIEVNITISELFGSVPAYVFVVTDISTINRFRETEVKRNQELEAANKAFSDQQRAMINLLEDSRDLGEQLQIEKADVEHKVEQRTLEVRAERTRLEASINSLDIGFIIVDTDKNTITSNQAIRSIMAVEGSEGVTTLKEIADKLKGNLKLESVVDECERNGKTSTENNISFGTKVLRIFIAPVFDASGGSNSIGAVILIEDISEAKAIERSRDEFFSIASHELRTPLTAIRGNTKMIMDYYKEQLSDPMLAEMVDDIHDSSIRLITIVNDFLDTSRLEQGKISFEMTEFDAADLAKDIAQEFKAGAVNPDLYIKIKVPLALTFVVADRDRLKQSLINLVGNAFKFTEKGGVTITLRPVKKTLCIEVADTGKGVPEESQNLLFRKFQQASNNILTRDSTRSTGLGLYISKLLMEGMKGKIYLKSSEVGKGSVFVIEVPLAPSKLKAVQISDKVAVKKPKKLQIH